MTIDASSSADVEIRLARPQEVPAICAFGTDVLPAHYGPLIGAAAAAELVADWWNPEVTSRGVAAGAVWVAVDADGALVGVGELGTAGGEPVVYRLYVAPGRRGRGFGVRLLDAMIATLPEGTPRVLIEHVAANRRAGAFHQREGFVIDRIDVVDPAARDRDVVWRARPLSV